MNALMFLSNLLSCGIRLRLEGESVVIEDSEKTLNPGKCRLLKSLRPFLRDLLKLELPEGNEASEQACEGFAAAIGVALCRRCGHGLGEHFWRSEHCTFHVGSYPNMCSRCGLSAVQHLSERHRDASFGEVP